jgi:hypothetical protein
VTSAVGATGDALGWLAGMASPTAPPPDPVVRRAVRQLLLSSESYLALDPARRAEAARAMVRVCQTATDLLKEEAESDIMVQAQQAPREDPATGRPPLAVAQATAGEKFSGVATDKVADTTRKILNAVSFPRFVTELINGVFKAIVDSNQQQMQAFVDLITHVSASLEGFADTNLGPDRARQWLIDQFPGSFEMEGGPDEDTDPRDRDEEAQEATIRLKEGASMPSEAALRTVLHLGPEETVPSGDPESTLLPFARRALARQRQQLLASMVMLGLQRLVIDSGRINAAMRFHIDTRSAATADEGSRFDFENKLEAKGSFSVGPWGAEAKMTNTIGYVSTQHDQTTEEMNTDVDLNSSVELIFRTDYFPLERLAGGGQVDRIKVHALNPEAELKLTSDERKSREASARQAESARSKDFDALLAPRPERAAPAPSATAPKAPATDQAKPAPEKKAAPAKQGEGSTQNRSASATKAHAGEAA